MSNRYINILDYGAVADGVTDCTNAIANAIRDANSANDIVIFPTGSYVVSSSINVGSNSNITIDGCNSTLLVKKRPIGELFNVSLKNNITIKNLIIDGLNIGTDTTTAITLYNSSNCLIENVTIVNWYGIGIFCSNAYKCIIRKCTLYNIYSAQAIGLDKYPNDCHYRGNGNNVIDNCEIHTADLDGIICNDDYCTIMNSHIYMCGRDVSKAVGAIGACGIWCAGNGKGDGISIINNRIHGHTDSSVGLNNAKNVRVIGNMCYDNALAGIYTSGENVIINGNIVYNNGYSDTTLHTQLWRKSGIAILDGAKKVSVTGNVSFDDRDVANRTQTYGIDIVGNVEYTVVSGNIMQPSKIQNISSSVASGGTERVLYGGLNQ